MLTLGRIESLLTSPEATKVREQLQLAMARYRRGLDSNNRDSADDLDDALRLFEGIVGNPVGNQIHGVWYYLGILYESHVKDLRKALAAYKNAQRLAADLDDKDGIYLDSVLSLCKVHYRLQEFAEAYSRIIGLVQLYPGHTGVAFDAARYCAVTGREAECFAFLRQCLAKDRLFYVKILCDADFAALPGFDAFIATLIGEAKAEVLPDLQHLEKTLAVVERALRQYDLAPLEDYRKRMGELLSELENRGYVGVPKVQADVRRMNNSVIRSAETSLGLVVTKLNQRVSEIESDVRAANALKEYDSERLHSDVVSEINRETGSTPIALPLEWVTEINHVFDKMVSFIEDNILGEQLRPLGIGICIICAVWSVHQVVPEIANLEGFFYYFMLAVATIGFAVPISIILSVATAVVLGFIKIWLILLTKLRVRKQQEAMIEIASTKRHIESDIRSRARNQEIELDRRHTAALGVLHDSLKQEDRKIATVKGLIAELAELRVPEPGVGPA